jgi:hypothetical protein
MRGADFSSVEFKTLYKRRRIVIWELPVAQETTVRTFGVVFR